MLSSTKPIEHGNHFTKHNSTTSQMQCSTICHLINLHPSNKQHNRFSNRSTLRETISLNSISHLRRSMSNYNQVFHSFPFTFFLISSHFISRIDRVHRNHRSTQSTTICSQRQNSPAQWYVVCVCRRMSRSMNCLCVCRWKID